MISILVAYTKQNRVIGKGGIIPWNLPSERNRFKQICKDKYIIMGRKSFEEIGHSLPYCTIIIISKTLKTAPAGCLLANSLDKGIDIALKSAYKKQADKGKAIPFAQTIKTQEILIAGGGEIYSQALKMAETTTIYATEIEKEYEGDVYFPQLQGSWKKTVEAVNEENNIIYSYVTYTKRKADQQ